MPPFEPGGGFDDEPATVEEYKLVREGKGSAEQIARVLAALKDKESLLYLALGETATWARWNTLRRFDKPGPVPDRFVPLAQRNFFRVIEYLRHKREAGVLSDDEVNAIIDTNLAPHLDVPAPTPLECAMGVARMLRAITRLHPELASEAKALTEMRGR